MSELIDTTQMYLRTVFELIEEEIPPMRARIAERLHQSGPTVSQTVARMERDGLLNLDENRVIELTPEGLEVATAVMRKHRLAERLLLDVIGLDWSLLHDEACRWEHVISDAVEDRLVSILGDVSESPYGNPIPALDGHPVSLHEGATPLTDVLPEGTGGVRATVVRLGESIQAEPELLPRLAAAGILPGRTIRAAWQGAAVIVSGGSGECPLIETLAQSVFVRPMSE